MISSTKSAPKMSSERNSSVSSASGDDKQTYKKPHAAFTENAMWQNATPQPDSSSSNTESKTDNATESSFSDIEDKPYVPPNNVSNGTSEALQFLESVAVSTLETVSNKIAENDKFLDDKMQNIDVKSDLKNTIEVKKIKISRDFEIIADKKTGEQKKKITYKPEIVTERIAANSVQAQKVKYRVLSHKTGSSLGSSVRQELMQVTSIAAKKGVLHAVSALTDKVDTPLKNQKLLHGTLSAMKNSALAAETIAVTASEKAVEGGISTMKKKLDESGGDEDSYKASKFVVTIATDVVSDLGTIKDHAKDKWNNRFDRQKDLLEKKHDIKSDKLEKEKAKAESKVEEVQQRSEKYKPNEAVKSSENNLHSIEKNGLKQQTRLKMQDKTTVKASAEKSHVILGKDNEKAAKPLKNKRFTTITNSPSNAGVVERLIENGRVNNSINQSINAPHKYVMKAKIAKIDGKRVLKIEVGKEDLRVRPQKKIFAIRAVNKVTDLADGRIEFGKTEPSLLDKLGSNAANRIKTRGAATLREKVQNDGGDNDAVRAVDGAITQAQNIGKAYDSAKHIASSARSSVQSALQPLNAKLEDRLISAERKVNNYLSEVRGNKQSLLQPKSELKKKENLKKTDTRKRRYKQNRRHVYIEFRNRETRNMLFKQFAEGITKKVKTVVVGGGAVLLLIMLLPLMIGGGGSGVVSGTLTFGAVTSPTTDNDMTLSEQYWTELAENLIKEFREFPSKNSGDKYVVADNSVYQLNHDTFKLLAYLSVKCQNDEGEWNFEGAKDEIEAIFNEQYELVSEELIETKHEVTTIISTYDSPIYNLGTSRFYVGFEGYDNVLSIGVPTDNEGRVQSSWYSSYAVKEWEIYLGEWKTSNTINDVIIDNGVKLDTPQSKKYENKHGLYLKYPDDPPTIEYWTETFEKQIIKDYQYTTYTYGIKEKKSFDTIIEERIASFTEEQIEMYELYLMFNLAHQSYFPPVNPSNVTDYAGYNTDVNQTDGLYNSITISTAMGNDIYAPCTGTLTKTGETSISIYNPSNKCTIYIDGVIVATSGSVTKKAVIGKASGDSIKITITDKDGKNQNPYLFIDWSANDTD